MTAALEWDEWSVARPDRTLPPGKTRYPFYRRLGGLQGRYGRAQNLVPTAIRSRTTQPVVSRYTDRATRPTYMYACMYVHVYMYVYMYVCVYICVYVCSMYVRMYICMYVYMSVYTKRVTVFRTFRIMLL